MTDKNTTPKLNPTFQRIAIINRGECGLRFVRACREFNLEHGTNLQSIAFVTSVDRDTPYARQADICVELDVPTGTSASSVYLDEDYIITKVKECKADAVWVGWGFVAEVASFARAVEDAGLTFLGPKPRAMELAGDKIAAKRLAEEANVPVVPWSGDPVDTLDRARKEAGRIGYPVVLKAAAGGGGRGIRRVDSEDELEANYHSAHTEAEKAFGDGRLFVERCVTRARHLEVQIACDTHGNRIAFGVRDCTVQRRNQKVVEEAPGPHTTKKLRQELEAYAIQLAEASDYRSVGTVEFIYDLDADQAYFMEVNTRLQVEHPITELTYQRDLVKTQIAIASGAEITPPDEPIGYAIEVRLNAEDPDKNFSPAPGYVTRFRAPQGPGIRVDSGVVTGSEITPDFDSMVAKVIAYGRDRDEALARLERAVQDTSAMVQDGATNKTLLAQILKHPDYRTGAVDTKWLDRTHAANVFQNKPHATEALITAAILSHVAEAEQHLKNFSSAVSRGIPQSTPPTAGHETELTLDNNSFGLKVFRSDVDTYRIRIDGHGIQVASVHFDDKHSGRLRVGGRWMSIEYQVSNHAFVVDIEGIAHRIGRGAGGVVRASSPAIVMDIAIEEGARVNEGDRLGSLEAMKMETPIRAPQAGIVRNIFVQRNAQVPAGAPLFEIEPINDEEKTTENKDSGQALQWPASNDVLSALPQDELVRHVSQFEGPQHEALAQALIREIEPVLLGYDTDEEQLKVATALLDSDIWSQLPHAQAYAGAAELLEMFADIETVFSPEILPRMKGMTTVSHELAFYDSVRRLYAEQDIKHTEYAATMDRALRHYGVTVEKFDTRQRLALMRLNMTRQLSDTSNRTRGKLASSLMRMVLGLHEAGVDFRHNISLEQALQRIPKLTTRKTQFLADNAYETRYVLFHQLRFEKRASELKAYVEAQLLQAMDAPAGSNARTEIVQSVVCVPQTVTPLLHRMIEDGNSTRLVAAEVLVRRLYNASQLSNVRATARGGFISVEAERDDNGVTEKITSFFGRAQSFESILNAISEVSGENVLVDLTLFGAEPSTAEATLTKHLESQQLTAGIRRISLALPHGQALVPQKTWVSNGNGKLTWGNHVQDLHPEQERRLELWRYQNFNLERIDAHERLLVYKGIAKENPKDERIFVLVEVRDVPGADADSAEHGSSLGFEHAFLEAARSLRSIQAARPERSRLHWSRIILHVRPTISMTDSQVREIADRLEVYTLGLGLECVIVRAAIKDRDSDKAIDTEIQIGNVTGHSMEVRFQKPRQDAIPAATGYELKVQKARAMGVPYPYEILRMLTPEADVLQASADTDIPSGTFVEYDLAEGAEFTASAVERPVGKNTCGIVFGLIRHQTDKYPEGIERVLVLSDPLFGMGALAEPECSRILAAINLAESRKVPMEWVPVSSGALISMDSGTENLDWTARVLRRIIEFTQAGGEINVIVDGVNVGAQSYFDAEATMLMHTKGALIMTPRASMVLTGKKALDYSGSVSAENERGIGGYERIMGPNGQAQYFAHDLKEAFQTLIQRYSFTYIAPGESRVRPAKTSDRDARDPTLDAYSGGEAQGFTSIAHLFSEGHNGERKKPFEMRQLMKSVVDRDSHHLEAFSDLRYGDTGIVWHAHMGGIPVCLIGIESQPMARFGHVPGDGPDTWVGGTLYPQSSRKVARAINAASGTTPVVVMANLSGFDGSPESMRKLQLEFGAEIGRAVVNFDGPIIFCVVGRYHGGAYVVFSKTLNENLTSMAVDGSFASVIGGAPAAAVVFARDVRNKTEAHPTIKSLRQRIQQATTEERPKLREELASAYTKIQTETQHEIAREFDSVHTVQRAKKVGSLDQVIAPEKLRSGVIVSLRQGVKQAARNPGSNEKPRRKSSRRKSASSTRAPL